MKNRPSEWQKFFDAHAPEYMGNEFTKNTVAETDFIIRELQLEAGCSIIDVGCGTGRHAVELARRGFRVTGLDLSAGMLREAEKAAAHAGVSVRWRQADAADFETDETFEAAICLCEGAFGLLGGGDNPADHDLAILRNINRALKSDGGFILTCLNGFKLVRKYGDGDVASGRFNPLDLTERYDLEYETPEGKKSLPVAERGFVPGELRLMLNMTGFEVIHLGGGTAGNWGKRTVDLDEYELMAICRKARSLSPGSR